MTEASRLSPVRRVLGPGQTGAPTARFWSSAVLILLALGALLVAWQFLPGAFGLPSYVFPSLTEVVSAFRGDESELISALWTTLTEATTGVVIGVAVGLFLGAVAYYVGPLRRGLLSVLLVLNSTPQIGLAPVAVLFLGSGLESKIVLIAFVTSFTLLLYTLQGLDLVPKEEERLLQSFGSTELRIFAKLRFRRALPTIMAGVRYASSQAIILAIVVEIFSSNGGIGHVILVQTSLAGYQVMWAAALEGAVAGLALFGLASLLEKRLTWWVG
jgi:NitT/TauT family transport system permease protein